MNEPDPRDPRLDAAYRDAATEAPRPEIDARIRAAARRAVSTGPQSLEARARSEARRSWVARWRVPVSIAASVVVAVTLSYMMEREATQLARVDGLPSRAPPPPAAGAPAETETASKDVVATAPALEAPPAAQKRDSSAPAQSNALPRAQPDAGGAARESGRADEAQRVIAPAPAPAAPAPAQALAAPAPQAPAAEEETGSRGMLAKESETRQAAGAAAPAAAPPAPAPAAKPAAARDLAEPASRDRALTDRPMRMERSAAPVAAEQKARTPEEWLEALRRLKAQGRTDELVKELAEFRKRYPDYKLPADLVP